ncbi:hypothetical protein BJ742DRAFT_737116 [Cladochytrium replicatum]|nr:hypothetical protein BJ742DRAFT_737116 [Cladochytrium replicatum]
MPEYQPHNPSHTVLQLTTDARNMHGLRHQDFQRYRQFCSRKIRRSRAAVGLQQRRRKFEKKEVEPELVKDEKVGGKPRKKHHLIQKLRRAAQAANELQTVSGNVVDARTMLELQAYAESMEGYVYFEQQKWNEALENFAAARTIYERLAKAAATPHQETLCQSAVDALDPNIRYPLNGGQTLDVGALIEMQSRAGSLGLLSSKVEARKVELFQEHCSLTTRILVHSRTGERAAQIHSISWRGKSVPTKSHTLAESIFQAQQLADVLDNTTAEVPVQKVLQKAVEPEDDSKADRKSVEERMDLFDKCWEQVKSDYDAEDAETVKKLADNLSDLETRIRAENARKVLESAGGVESISSGVEGLGIDDGAFVEPPLIDRLTSFVPTIDPQNPNLVAFPPQLRPVGCKPLSFDVGFSYLEFPCSNLKQLASGKERTEWVVNATEDEDGSKGT